MILPTCRLWFLENIGMPLKPKIAAALLAAAAVAPMAHAATITIEPGPEGEGSVRVITPWGNFVSVQEGDTIWVGTESEFYRSRAIAISPQDGYRVFRRNGARSGAVEFVSAGLQRAWVGNDELADISISVLFGIGPGGRLRRPALPATDERVQVAWTASGRQPVRAMIYDGATKRTFRPYRCAQTDFFDYCEWGIPRAALTQPVNVIFTSRGLPPGVISGRSIVQMHYAGLRDKYKPDGGAPLDLDPGDRSDLAKLHRLDPAIPPTIIPGK